MNKLFFYICALISIMQPLRATIVLEITDPGNYEIRHTNNALVLVDCDDEHRLYNLQAAIQSGGFQLAANIQNQFIIAADNVTMNLGGHKVAGGIVIAPNKSDITITNGLVGGKFASSLLDGIRIHTGCSNVTLDGLQISNATAGINVQNLTGGLIKNCDMSKNSTGVLLQDSSQITIDNSRACSNTHTGFSLVASGTCCILNSKALSNGENNTQTFGTEVFGFVSLDGINNIFERCIANSTQALSTTDFNSIVAGIALRGSEQCTKIIDCEAANAQTSASGVTIPYGILLEGQFVDNELTLTAVPPMPIPDSFMLGLSWSPDGKYVATAYNETETKRVRIYEYDRMNQTMIQVATPDVVSDKSADQVAWSPDGLYLTVVFHKAIGTGESPGIRIYRFEQTNNTLTQVDVIDGVGSVTSGGFSVDWHPSGTYFAIGMSGVTDNFGVFSFNRIEEQAVLFVVPQTGDEPEQTPLSIQWSPSGKYLAEGNTSGGGATTFLRVYSFDSANTQLNLLAFPVTAPSAEVQSVAWSPDENYLAVASAGTLFIYRFENNTLTLVETLVSSLSSVEWSSDGKLLMGLASSSLTIYEFDRGNNQLNQIATTAAGQAPSSANFASWSPDGGAIAVGTGSGNILLTYNALILPSKNIVKDNVVYCNGSANGVGISASSICNLVIENTAYSNPTALPAGFDNNYAFVTNVFNQLFGDDPTMLQNISLNVNDPITMPDDLALLIKQMQYKLCNPFATSFDIFESVIENFSSNPCDSVTINAPTTITTSGIYCLSQMIAGKIMIDTADNIQLDLNNYRVTGGIEIAAGLDNITIKNGTVQNVSSADGIRVNAGASNIFLSDLKVQNSLVGINFDNVTGGMIERCTMSKNVTGVELDASNNITIDSCIADCNMNAGYCLISSTTNCLKDCKALSTGQGNENATDQTIFGFVSTNGNANIFERCIANSTQALSTIDSQSLVAGFALRENEGCSKIIECEATNAQTSSNGFTIPYGILLEETLIDPIAPIIVGDPASGIVLGLAWSPDAKYIATTGNNDALNIYELDRQANVLLRVAIKANTLDGPEDLAWSPDGRHIAVVDDDVLATTGLHIYSFDSLNNVLEQVAFDASPNNANTVSWHPLGQFILVAESGQVRLYQFNQVTNQLIQVSVGISLSGLVLAKWSPDGNFVAILDQGNDEVAIYAFDQVSGIFTEITSLNVPSSLLLNLDWSPDGKYLAVTDSSGDDLLIFEFNATKSLLIARASQGGFTTPIFVSWSPNGKYLAVTDFSTSEVIVFEYNRSDDQLIQRTSANTTVTPNNVVWGPDGEFLAIGNSSSNQRVAVYKVLDFPTKNSIKNNIVYCNSGGLIPSGIGISGSSIANYIVGNTVYCNPLEPFMVGSNYVFVTNVFNQLFQNKPTLLQNISVDCNAPIFTPDNETLLAKQLLAKVDDLGQCGPTAITSDDISGGTISLTEAGSYCLAQNVTADFSITATCVSLDLNNRCVTGVIAIATSDDVFVHDGFVLTPIATSNSDSAAITIESTSNRTTISNIGITCADSSGTSIDGRNGIEILGNDAVVMNCKIAPGAGSDTAVTSGTAGDGGSSIMVASDAIRAVIEKNILMGANGGSYTGFVTGSGGNGGSGVLVQSGAINTVIRDVIIMCTGNGGNSSEQVAGEGGHGVKIESGAIDTQVTKNVIRNTGVAGMGDSPIGGKAVDDDVSAGANESQVFANFAHNIAATINFDLQASGVESGVASPNPPTNTVINPLANVYA